MWGKYNNQALLIRVFQVYKAIIIFKAKQKNHAIELEKAIIKALHSVLRWRPTVSVWAPIKKGAQQAYKS